MAARIGMDRCQNSRLHVRNTFLQVADRDNDAPRLARSKSDPCLSDSSASSTPPIPEVEDARRKAQSSAGDHIVFSSSSGSSGSLISSQHLEIATRRRASVEASGQQSNPEQQGNISRTAGPEVKNFASGCSAQPELTKLVKESLSSTSGGQIWSAGAESHAEGRCRPCAWQWQENGCAKGVDCPFCHLCNEAALKEKSKRWKKAAKQIKGLEKRGLQKKWGKEELEQRAASIWQTAQCSRAEGDRQLFGGKFSM